MDVVQPAMAQQVGKFIANVNKKLDAYSHHHEDASDKQERFLIHVKLLLYYILAEMPCCTWGNISYNHLPPLHHVDQFREIPVLTECSVLEISWLSGYSNSGLPIHVWCKHYTQPSLYFRSETIPNTVSKIDKNLFSHFQVSGIFGYIVLQVGGIKKKRWTPQVNGMRVKVASGQ